MLELVVPQHVVRGQNIKLECNFNLDGETLYSVKWYKDGNEFYRYVPQERPPVLVFQLPGVTANVRIILYWFFSLVSCHCTPLHRGIFYLKIVASHFYRVSLPGFLLDVSVSGVSNFTRIFRIWNFFYLWRIEYRNVRNVETSTFHSILSILLYYGILWNANFLKFWKLEFINIFILFFIKK